MQSGGGLPSSDEEIRKAIRSKYAEVSLSAAGKFQYPTGRDGAKALGYREDLIAAAPSVFFESFCGIGNPFSLGEIHSGESVLDIGCGAGFDLFVAKKLAGEKSRISGIDLTESMVMKAKKNLALAGMEDVDVTQVHSESIPYGDSLFDVVISNGVFNLSVDKAGIFQEINRVLKPGGRLQFADIVLENELPESLKGSAEAWSQ